MGYSVKMKFPIGNELDVSGDDLDTVVALINGMSKKFFQNSNVNTIEIIP